MRKPLTHWSQFEAARDIARTARETGRVFQLGTQGLSDPAWWQMKALVQEGLIGQPAPGRMRHLSRGGLGGTRHARRRS